ncbi:MAG: putative porin [Xanthomonadales bacterium]|nr:putative porin [Xanthomonadales bacterium]
MNFRNTLALVSAAAVLQLQPAHADDPEIAALREQLAALSARIDAVEASNQALKAENKALRQASETQAEAIEAVQSGSKSGESWSDRISIKGDLRTRFESIDEQGRDRRNRDRIRARASIIAEVNEQLEVGLGLASGSDDPVSTNQTLGSGGSTKGLNLDLAYLKWKTANGMTIHGGKFKNHLYKAGSHALLWDGDWTPEGVGISWKRDALFFNAIGTWLESDSRKESEFSYGIQGGFSHELGDDVTLTAGAGYYQFDTAGKGTFFGDDDDFFGNTPDASGSRYLYDYEELELFAELDFPLAGRGATIFANYVQNQDAPTQDTGYAFGFKLGSAKQPGEWQLGWTYQDLEADAVYGLLTDSDFAGGGTGGKGHILKGGYAIARNVNANLTWFMTERFSGTPSERDYDRLQVDLAIKY